MAVPGPRSSGYIDKVAGSLLRSARIMTSMTQQQVADAAGVPRSTVARVESFAMQPTYPMLQRLIIATGLEVRTRLEPYDDHDDVLDKLDALDPDRAARAKAGADAFAMRMDPAAAG